ncbi:MAG: PD40 domain-containing protein [Anaerolineales bacterium]|uniref:hypothetical protein n=1 Tax=Candidatus Villigracilis proximus TaxID=3140683 RepID=UPI00313558FB|nr:PD40 domain-containing protein [Anaerolineales bacterium]
MKFDGSQPKQLTTGGATGFNTDPNEQYLTYNTYDRALKILDIVKKTSELIAKPSNYSEWVWAHSWSPDGKKLIYTRVINPANDNICSLFIYDVVTKKSTELMGVGCDANWSPDGKSILFTTKEEGQIFNTHKDQQLQIGILNLEKGDISYVPVGAYSYYSGSWSRNGKQLLMAVIDEQKQTYLYVFNWKDSSVNLISKIGYLQWPIYYSWSPDGNMVLYELIESSLSYKHYLYLLDIKNKEITNLHTLLGLDTRFDYWWKYSPIWSPDGKYYAYFTMSSMETNYEQNFVLNIKSIESEGNIQFQVPRKGFSIRMLWINNETEFEN